MQTIMKPGKEVVVTVPDKLGLLSDITTTIAEAHINVNAICAYTADNVAHLRLVTDDNKRAVDALSRAGFKANEHDILVCQISPHFLHQELEKIVNNYEVKSNYWCAATHNGEHAVLIFSPKENFQSTVAAYT